MTNTGNDSGNKSLAGDAVEEEMHVYEDEIDLMDYFLVLWKHKWLILVCSVLPALIVGLGIYHSPRSYKVTYTYDVRGDARDDVRGDVRDDVRGDVSNWNLNEKNFNVLQSRFYSKNNTKKIIGKSKKDGLDEDANPMSNGAGNFPSSFVKFTVLPSFVDTHDLKVADPDQLVKLRDMKAFLLNMTITIKTKEALEEVALAVKSNFEEAIPLYTIQDQVSTDIRGYNYKLADIEGARFSLELALKNNIEMLAGLKKVDVIAIDKESNIVLQFNVSEYNPYLPLSYEIQALESKNVELEGKINADKANYKYFEDLLGLSTRMIAELNDKLSSDQNYTIEQYKSFLVGLAGEIEKQELKDYLASYIKKIENRISVSAPVTENPKMSSIAKGTVKKCGIVFAVAFMLSVLVSFLLEGIKRRRESSRS